MLKEAIAILFSFVLCHVESHSWGYRSCPSVEPIENLNLEKFLGEWHVIKQFDTSSKCLKFTYQRDSDTTVKIKKTREIVALKELGLDHTNSYTGNLDIPFGNNQGFMRVKWPFNIGRKGDYYVIDTDYETYAVVYDCQNILPWFRRESAAILSREPTLDDIFIDRCERKLKDFQIDTSKFSDIDHRNCTEDPNYKLDFDENTLRDVFNTATNVVTDAAKEAAAGIEGVAETVSKTFRGEQEEESSKIKEKAPKK